MVRDKIGDQHICIKIFPYITEYFWEISVIYHHLIYSKN
jgi:hypothetical protein